MNGFGGFELEARRETLCRSTVKEGRWAGYERLTHGRSVPKQNDSKAERKEDFLPG